MSMKNRLAFILLFFAFVPSLVIGGFSYTYVSRQLIDMAGQTAYSLAVSNRDNLQFILDDQKESLVSLTTSSLVEEILTASYDHTISHNDDEYQRLYPLLVKKANKSSICQKISIYNTENTVIVSSDETCLGVVQNDLSNLSFKENEAIVTASLSHPDNVAYYYIDVIRPYYKDSELFGYVVSTIDTSYFDNMMQSAHLEDNCSLMLSDSAGMILYHTNSQFIGKTLDQTAFTQLEWYRICPSLF